MYAHPQLGQESTRVDVLIAVQPILVRHGLVGMLTHCQPEWHLTEADSLEAVLNSVSSTLPNLLLLDARLPSLDGINGMRRLRALAPEVKILVLADTDERMVILRWINAGARGYLTQSSDPGQILCAFSTVLAGGVFAPASLTRPISDRPTGLESRHPDDALAMLTERQREVFDLMAMGCATKTIARQLDLAVGTVKVHLAAIYRAFGAHSRTEAMARARGVLATPILSRQHRHYQRETV
ncbi:MAG TPA: response regulator transcription factor [Rhodopila sp.]|nr:response regulator transcription factor [Rhodopila sp.]